MWVAMQSIYVIYRFYNVDLYSIFSKVFLSTFMTIIKNCRLICVIEVITNNILLILLCVPVLKTYKNYFIQIIEIIKANNLIFGSFQVQEINFTVHFLEN